MALEVSTDPLFESGEIKFSELRDTFKGTPTENGIPDLIKASELFRDTNTNQPSPLVPDATENANISADGTDLSLLGFRNCIKTYNIKQNIGETDTNINLTTATWNSNLSKNIPKSFIVEGTIGSTNPINPALTLSGVVRNFTIDVTSTGKIHGAGGAAGNVSINHGSSDTRRTGYVAGDGQDGGEAISLDISTPDEDTKIVNINLVLGSELWAGGGGGGVGSRGGTGGTGATVQGMNGGTGGTGGNPGNGGDGQGYNNPTAAGDGQDGGAGGAGGAGDTKEYRFPESSVMTTYTFSAGTGGTGGNGGNGGNGGDWGSGGNTGSTTGATDGDKGTSTSTNAPEDPIIYTVPSNPFTGMTIQYTELNRENLRDGDKGTPVAKVMTPYEVDGVVVGYHTLKFTDSHVNDDDPNDYRMYINTPTLGEGEVAAPHARFTKDGLGLVADGPGKIKVLGVWSDTSSGGRAVENIKIYSSSGTPVDFTRTSNEASFTATFDYDPKITNGNLVSFSMFREAGHDNFITFGGKYDTDQSNHIDQTGVIPTFGPGSNYSSEVAVDTLSFDYPSGKYGPVWGVDTGGGGGFPIQGMQVYTNIFGYGLTGIQLDDEGGSGGADNDYNDLMIIPTTQTSIQLASGSILPPEAPSKPPVERYPGNSGYAIKKIGTTSYNLTGNINTGTILGSYSAD